MHFEIYIKYASKFHKVFNRLRKQQKIKIKFLKKPSGTNGFNILNVHSANQKIFIKKINVKEKIIPFKGINA